MDEGEMGETEEAREMKPAFSANIHQKYIFCSMPFIPNPPFWTKATDIRASSGALCWTWAAIAFKLGTVILLLLLMILAFRKLG